MRKDKVLTNYGHLGHDELAILGGKVAGLMQANTYFPTITPSAADLLAATEDYRIKHEVAINGGSTLDKNLKKESRIALLNMFNALASAVNVQAKGDTVALSSTGLLFAKLPETVGLPGTTTDIRPKDGPVSGQMHLTFSKIARAREYEIQVGEMDTLSGTVAWELTIPTTKSFANIIEPLTPGTRYYVRVRGRNGKGFGDWSDPVSMIVR